MFGQSPVYMVRTNEYYYVFIAKKWESRIHKMRHLVDFNICFNVGHICQNQCGMGHLYLYTFQEIIHSPKNST